MVTINGVMREYINSLKPGTTFTRKEWSAAIEPFDYLTSEPYQQAMCELERNRDIRRNVLFGRMTRYGLCPSWIWRDCGGMGDPARGRYVKLADNDPRAHWWLRTNASPQQDSVLDDVMRPDYTVLPADVIDAAGIEGRLTADQYEQARAKIRRDGRFVHDITAPAEVSRYIRKDGLTIAQRRETVLWTIDRACASIQRAAELAHELGFPNYIDRMQDKVREMDGV